MIRKTYWLGLLGALAMVFAACSDDSGGDPKPDVGVDQAVKNDIAPPIPDTGPDTGVPPLSCEKKCTDEASYLCVSDPGSGDCVECLQDGHCAGNPGALGPKCSTQQGICICEANADCAANKNGKVCDTDQGLCSCATDADCTGTDKCVGSLFGAKICAPPCTADTDCTSDSRPKCDTASGECVACLTDTDCKEDDAPYCNAGSCAQCSKPEHCTGNLSGNACVDGGCSCAANTDCSATSWGPTCVTKSTPFGDYKECGCNADTDCGTTNQNGPTCFTKYNKCSCGADTDCTVTGVDKCNFPYGGAEYSHCQKACTTNDDCKDIRDLNLCDTVSGKCAACVSDTDCSGTTPFCSPTTRMCVACKADTDCTTPSAPFCGTKGECVECKADTDCTGSFLGGKCTADGACGCDADTDCSGTNAWGNKCITAGTSKRCGCTANQECTGNANGPTCDSQNYGTCTCSADGDCTVGGQTKCGKAFAGIAFNSCQKPCTANTDCVAKEGLAVCDTAKSLCIACQADTDCTYNSFQTTCNSSNSCVECLADADCNPNGLGPKCDTQNNFCVCASDTECASNPNGKKCDSQLQACSCATDADCPTGKKCTGEFAQIPICQ